MVAVSAALAFLACGDEVDDRPVEWAFIAPVILAPNCATASCHSKGAAESGLDLSEPNAAYASLVGQQAQFFLSQPIAQPDAVCRAERGGTVCTTSRPLIQPCRPDESRVINMLRARGAQRMPPDRPMPVADIELIERWILAGAKRKPGDSLPSCGVIMPDAAVIDAPQSSDAQNAGTDGGTD
jgi:hypothetical protein